MASDETHQASPALPASTTSARVRLRASSREGAAGTGRALSPPSMGRTRVCLRTTT